MALRHIPPPQLTAATAFAVARMTDDRSAPNAGVMLRARDGAVKLKWADVTIAKNETSLELEEKTPPGRPRTSARRTCW